MWRCSVRQLLRQLRVHLARLRRVADQPAQRVAGAGEVLADADHHVVQHDERGGQRLRQVGAGPVPTGLREVQPQHGVLPLQRLDQAGPLQRLAVGRVQRHAEVVLRREAVAGDEREQDQRLLRADDAVVGPGDLREVARRLSRHRSSFQDAASADSLGRTATCGVRLRCARRVLGSSVRRTRGTPPASPRRATARRGGAGGPPPPPPGGRRCAPQ